MSNMRIIEIPASMRENAGRKNTVRKLRVAAYCRVSTEEEEQQGSFEIQKLYYTEKINSTPEWEVAGIYADDGISGVHTKKRDGFNQMIQDCKKHKIDLILTKSISRFARNTLDSIQYVRMLKQMGIAVIFEKENINTATMNSEMILGYVLFHFYRKEVAMKLGEKIKLVRKHRGLTQRELGERLHLDGNAANRIAQYESGFRTPKESRTKDIAKALNVREENFFTRADTPEDIIRLMIWYDWEHGCGGSVPIDTILLFDNFEEVEKLLKEWYSQKEKLRARTITRAKYLEWMLH